jgi:transcription termination/antitermination protein NusG
LTQAGEGAWFACYTMVNRERKVEALLRQRGITSYVPVVQRLRQWHDRKKRIEQPLFPSYIFFRSTPGPLDHVLSTPGVAAVVRMAGRPVSIPHEEIENIARFARAIGESGQEPVRVTFEAGQHARILSGPFAGITGTVLAQRGGARVLVGVESLGIGFSVDVPAGSLDPVR